MPTFIQESSDYFIRLLGLYKTVTKCVFNKSDFQIPKSPEIPETFYRPGHLLIVKVSDTTKDAVRLCVSKILYHEVTGYVEVYNKKVSWTRKFVKTEEETLFSLKDMKNKLHFQKMSKHLHVLRTWQTKTSKIYFFIRSRSIFTFSWNVLFMQQKIIFMQLHIFSIKTLCPYSSVTVCTYSLWYYTCKHK